ncbi:chitin synthase III catalytic subunit [Armillaria mellea]|nr:chitin synthase III catalytic subunit [Armillaria mellea]
MARFGDFAPLCHHTPSYPWCNLFYRFLLDNSPDTLQDQGSGDPVGVNPVCGIPRVGSDGSISNIAEIVVCALSMVLVGLLIFLTNRRKAAVGRVELRFLLFVYFLTLPFSILTQGSLLEQGTTALVVLTAIHAGLVAAFFAALLTNAIVATQVVEDGTMASIMPFSILTLAFFVATLYISLDVALGFSNALKPSDPAASLHSIPLFVFTTIWPAACAVIFFALMAYIVLAVLNETRPMWFYVLAAVLFVLSQLAWFLLGRVICSGSNSKVDGSFVATLLETACIGVLYLAWRSITEESWDDGTYYPS